MGMLEDASAWLRGVARESLSVEIGYAPRTGIPVRIPATVGRTVFRAEDSYGVTVRTESVDFIVLTADLPGVPATGDTVICNGRTYEVLAPDGEPVSRRSGETGTRIHTKEVGNGDE